MDLHDVAVRIRQASYGPASAESVERQVAEIERHVSAHAEEFGYTADELSEEQADALKEVYLAERDLPMVEADDIRDIYDAHEPDAIPHNEDIIVLAVDETTWADYALVSAGEARAQGLSIVYTAAKLAERLAGAELTDDLAEEIAWEVTSEISPG